MSLDSASERGMTVTNRPLEIGLLPHYHYTELTLFNINGETPDIGETSWLRRFGSVAKSKQ